MATAGIIMGQLVASMWVATAATRALAMNVFTGLVSALWSAVTATWAWLVALGPIALIGAVIIGLVAAIWYFWDELTEFFGSFFSLDWLVDWLPDWVKSLLGIGGKEEAEQQAVESFRYQEESSAPVVHAIEPYTPPEYVPPGTPTATLPGGTPVPGVATAAFAPSWFERLLGVPESEKGLTKEDQKEIVGRLSDDIVAAIRKSETHPDDWLRSDPFVVRLASFRIA